LGRLAILALLGCLALAAIAHASVASMAAREFALFAGMAAIAFVAAGMRDPIDEPARVASIASASYVAVILLLVIAGYLAGQPLNRAEIFVGYDNYRFFNHVQTAALPASVLALALTQRGSWPRAVAGFAAIGGFALLFAVSGRGTLVGIAVGCAAVGMLFGRRALALLRTVSATALLGLVLFAVLFWLIPAAMGAQSDLPETYYKNRAVSDESRFFLWQIAVAYVEQSPWLGIGPMHYAHSLNAKAAHPHNIYLQIAAEWGLPMLVLLSGVGVYALGKLALAIRKCPNSRQRDCGIGLFLACIAILVDGVFSGNFVMPVSQVWIACLFGWAAAWMRRQPSDNMPAELHGHRWLRHATAVGLVASQLWLVWSVWPEVRQLDQHVKLAMERAPNAKMNPRFWSHGWF